VSETTILFESPLPEGFRLEEFTIIRSIGEGGFSVVYLARDHTLECDVAIKEYLPGSLASRSSNMTISARSAYLVDTFNQGLASFIKEAKLLRTIEHPSVTKVYRFFEGNGTAYMVMPFYQGQTLKKILLSKTKAVDEQWLKNLLDPILDALDKIHLQQCFHRDIAPDNIMVTQTGTPVLIDFGAARRVVGNATQALTVILKPGYAPVEQYAETSDLKQGAWTDIYALAGVLHYAIVGKAPVDSLSRILHDTQPKLAETLQGKYSAQFLAAIDKGLSVKPDDRFAGAREFRSALGMDNLAVIDKPQAKNKADASADAETTVLLKVKATNTSVPKIVVGMLSGAAVIATILIGWKFFSPAPVIAPPAVGVAIVEPDLATAPGATPALLEKAPEKIPEKIPEPTPEPKPKAAPSAAPLAAAKSQPPALPIDSNKVPIDANKTSPQKTPVDLKKKPTVENAPAAPETSNFNIAPILTEGSFWKYQRSDVWLNEIPRKTTEDIHILSVEPNSYRVMIQSGGLGKRERSFNKDGNQTYRVDGIAYVNHIYSWPMTIGKSWSISRIYTSTKTSQKVAVQEQCTVAKQETVTVPAGQFKTLRIDCQGFETPEGQDALRTETSRWYAPETRRFAKTSIKKWSGSTLTTSEVVVLTEYSLK
jgi:serine/threonine protein kinase